MERKRINILVGLAVVAVALTLLTLTLVDNLTSLFGKESYRVKCTLNHIGGLTVNAPVQFGGVIIGRVNGIRFLPEGKIVVTAQLTLEKPIPVDSVMNVSSTLVSGDVFINIYRGKSRELIAQETRNRDAVELVGVDYFGLSNLGTLFGNLGKLFSNVTESFNDICGHDSSVLRNIHQIENHGKEIRKQFAVLSQYLHKNHAKHQKIYDDLSALFAGGGKFVETFEIIFSPQYRQVLLALLEANSQNIVGLQESIANEEKTFAQITDDMATIQHWASGFNFSSRSVVSVLLSDPQYSVNATVTTLKEAYHQITDKSLFGKIALVVKSYFRARGITNDFAKNPRRRNATLEDFYREWLRHEYYQKANYGYIKSGKD